MTYEEAKQTAAGLLKDMPEQINIMHYQLPTGVNTREFGATQTHS